MNTQIADPSDSLVLSEPILLAEIEPDPANVRQHMDKAKLKELAASIQQHGVLQPILLRHHAPAEEPSPVRYRIIAGERRYRAAQAAGLLVIPALVWSVEEAAGLDLQLIENIQREDVHPLDEALGFQRMQQVFQLDLKALARRLGKDPRYMARRLALTDLIAEAKRDFRQEKLTLAHALELCRLAPEVQTEALAACYESQTVWEEEQQVHVTVLDKEKPVRHVRYLQEWIAQNVHLNLTAAPFQLDDPTLRTDGLTCLACPKRSGYNKTLFADIQDKDTCLHPACYQGKLQAFVQLQKTALEARTGLPVMYFSTYYGTRYEAENVLRREAYQLLTKRADRCRFAEQAICADGADIGRVQWICREEACQVHRPRATGTSSNAAGNGTTSSPSSERHARRQEIFDLKVEEEVRQRVMQEALATYTWPLERQHLQQVAEEYFARIPASDQKTICKILGWEEEQALPLRLDRARFREELVQMGDASLAQFLMLCSFAHYGANPARIHQVSQAAVVQLSQERGINHTLIDAQVRIELCPKKYRERHQDYLTLVKQNHPAPKPLVCERHPQTSPPTSVAGSALTAVA